MRRTELAIFYNPVGQKLQSGASYRRYNDSKLTFNLHFNSFGVFIRIFC